MKELPKHRVGEIVYDRKTKRYMVITEAIHGYLGHTVYCLKYVPESERLYNPLISFPAGTYSDIAFDEIFEMCLNI